MPGKDRLEVPKGLDGVIVDQTAVGQIDRAVDRLYYRGYPQPRHLEPGARRSSDLQVSA